MSVLNSWCLALALVVASNVFANLPAEPNWEGLVALEQGLWEAGRPAAGKTLWLRIEKANGQWLPVWGYSRDYINGGTFLGAVTASTETELSVRLVVDEMLSGKGARREGMAEYKVRFAVAGAKLEGAWQGTFAGETGQGKVGGLVEPVRPRTAKFVPPAPGEHPYLLCRQGDLPALRKKLQTPQGQQLIAALTGKDERSLTRMAVGHALLYALTGDKAYAEQAQQLIEADIHEGKWVRAEVRHPYVKVHDAGIVAGEAALAFDLIYDACAPEFRRNLVALFARRALYLWGSPANWSDTGNWSAMYRSGTGMCGLALLAEKEELWPRPAEPQIARLTADATLPAGEPLRSGETIKQWLSAGPLPLGHLADPTTALGGATARISAGTKVTVTAPRRDKAAGVKLETVTRTFEPAKTATPGVFNLGDRLGATVFFAAVVENAQAGYYALDFPAKKKHQWWLFPFVFVNGQRFASGEVVYLPAGRFAVLAPVQAAHCRSSEQMLWALKFTALAEPAAQAWLAQQRTQHALELAKWQIMRDAARAQGVNPWGLYWAGVGRQWVENWATWAVGSFGWGMAGEAYTQHSYRAVLPFAHAHRNALGADLVGRPNLRHALVRYTGQTMFRDDGAFLQGYGPGGAPLGVDGYARGFGLVPDPLKPAVLWGWNRTQQLAAAGKLKGAYLAEDFLDPMSAAFALVNRPEFAEVNPGTLLPKVLVDEWKGGFAFRNRWQDGDDIVATIYLNWNNAGGEWDGAETGEFRISGLGADWAVRGTGWGTTGTNSPAVKQSAQNLLELATPAEQGAPAAARYRRTAADGSAVLTLDMDYVYASLKKIARGQTLPPLPVHPRTAVADVYYATGIKGLRGWAVDYSGAAGVPALFVVVDQVTGTAGNNRWHLVTETNHVVTVAGNTFTLRAANGATLRGTVLAPASATITTRTATFGHEATYDGHHVTREFGRTILDVPAKDRVFVVMTLQKGDAPAVKFDGTTAQVGQQTIRFDGEKIVLGRFAGDAPPPNPRATAGAP